MTNDQKKDIMLFAIEFNGKPFTELYKKLIDPEEEEGKIDLLMDEMINEGLIQYENKNGTPREWCFMILNVKGQRMKEAGGILTAKYRSMSDEEKVHRILHHVFTTSPDQFGWDPQDLVPAFEGKLSIHEIQYICQLIIDNGDARDLSTKDGFGIGFIDRSKSAYYGKKYAQSKQEKAVASVHQTIHFGPVQTVNQSTIHGSVSQVSASTPPAPAVESKSVRFWQLVGKAIKVIVAPLLVAIIGAIVLKNCFGISP